MSEYWVSKKKYFCRYCDVYIADDAPSRSHHENGMRHKGNKERFVKGLYKAGEKKKKDLEEEKREMRNVEAAAQRAYALDVGAGRAGPSGSSLPEPKPKAAAAPPKKPSNPYANYTTAASLGYTDPDTERYQAELERRRTQGVAGAWELLPVASTSNSTPPPAAPEDGDRKPPTLDIDIPTGEKRPAEVVADDDDDGRAWKLRKKTARLGDDYDPGAIPIKIKPRVAKEDLVKSESSDNMSATNEATTSNGIVPATESVLTSTEVPKWTKIQWKKAATEPAKASSSSVTTSTLESTTDAPTISKPIIDNVPASESVGEPIPPAPPSDAGSGLFKKRKAPAGGSGRGRRDQF